MSIIDSSGFAGGRIDIAANQINLHGDLTRTLLQRTLERHVFYKMRQPVLSGFLHNGAGFDKQTDCRAAQIRQAFHHNNQTV